MLCNSAKLNEIGFLLKKSGKKIGCFITNPLPPVDEMLISAGRQDVLAGCMSAIDAQLKKYGIKRVICYNPESLSVLTRFSRSNAQFESITRLYAEMLKKKTSEEAEDAGGNVSGPVSPGPLCPGICCAAAGYSGTWP